MKSISLTLIAVAVGVSGCASIQQSTGMDNKTASAVGGGLMGCVGGALLAKLGGAMRQWVARWVLRWVASWALKKHGREKLPPQSRREMKRWRLSLHCLLGRKCVPAM